MASILPQNPGELGSPRDYASAGEQPTRRGALPQRARRRSESWSRVSAGAVLRRHQEEENQISGR